MSLCKLLAMSKKLFILLFIKEAAALSFPNCGTDNTLEVVSGINNTAVCSGLAGQRVNWKIDLNGVNIVVGTCEPDKQCDSLQPPDFIASRTSVTENTLTINTRLTLNGTLTCQIGMAGQPEFSEISCLTDTVIPAEGSCTVEFRRTPWVVYSQCSITRMYSARGRYSCQWYQTYKTATETPVGSSVRITQITSVGEKNFAGSCVLPDTTPMPRYDGSYSYRVTFIPGRKNVTVTFIGTNEILRPTLPVITCNNKDILPENTTITCTCEISNIGKPGGRLKLSKLYGTQTTVVNIGNYDVTRLDMTPLIVNRNDDGRLQFRCDVEWAETITGNTTGISVGYVDQSVIKVNNLLNLSVAENQAVTFNCSANGKPTPSMSLVNKGNGTVIRTYTSPLIHTLTAARCEDTSTYSCGASNGMGKNTTSDAKLYVNCTPRIRSDGIPPVPVFKLEVIQNQTASKQFDVVAYPTPNKFKFTFIGLRLTENISSSDLQGMILNATCRERQELYISNCTITAFNNNSDGGFYLVTVANAHGSVNVTLEVAINNDIPVDTSTPNPQDVLPVGAIVGIVIAVAVVVVAAVVIVFLVWRRRQGPKKDTSSLHDKKALYADNGNSNVQGNNSLKSNQCQTNPSFSLGEDLSGTNQHFSSSPSADKNISVNTNAPSLAPVGTTSKESEGYKGLPLMMQPPVREARSHHKQGKKRKEEQNKKRNKKQIKNTKETEYENVPGHEMKKLNQAKKEQGGLQNTAEGLTYMELDFSRNQPKKESHAAPVHETVEYAPIDFSRQPPKVQ